MSFSTKPESRHSGILLNFDIYEEKQAIIFSFLLVLSMMGI